MMIVVFFLVGFLELLSIAFRPISLSFRLYGNIFAGENLLEALSNTITHPAWAKAVFSALLPVPFYFLELLVGIVQAMVFMLLTAVFTALDLPARRGARKGASLRSNNFGGLTVFNRGSRWSKQKKRKADYGNAYVGGELSGQHSRRFGRPGFGHRRGSGRHESFRSGRAQSRRLRQDHHAGRARHGFVRSHRVLRDLPGRSLTLPGAELSRLRARSLSDL